MLTEIMIVAVPVALGIIMFGLGLTLDLADFVRVARMPRAVGLALLCQVIVVPLLGLGVVLALRLEPLAAVGVMVLLASPGGVLANLLSHLAGGDVALNLTLTAVNAIVAVVSLPVIVQLSVSYLAGDSPEIGLQYDKLFGVLALVVVPVLAGMWVRRRFPGFPERADRPFRVGTGVMVMVGVAASGVQYHSLLATGIVALGGVCLLIGSMSLAVGYWVPKLAGVPRPQSIACCMEIGVHNVAVALAVAFTALGNPAIAVAPIVYFVVVLVPVGVALAVFRVGERRAVPAAER